jgi:hypothetical protein
MKYGILKMAVVIGLVASSSLALAGGKFVFREPLGGVDASPTFGMTTTEKQAYQENLANIEMCAKEVKSTERFYNIEGDGKFYFSSLSTRTCDGLRQKSSDTVINDVLYTSLSGTNYSRGEHVESIGEQTITCGNLTSVRYTTHYYEVIEEVKTQNYDWCVNNGYKTAN